MRERGMIFNAEMVRAILDGRKTQTRRIMKPQPEPSKTRQGDHWLSSKKLETMVHISDFTPGHSAIADSHLFYLEHCCPFGQPGDRLWVRETFTGHYLDDDQIQDLKDGRDKADDLCEYRADYPDGHQASDGWTPSVHMPKWASRITLEITGVRVEQLQNISQSDAIAEGAPHSHPSIDAVSRDYGFPDFSRSWFGQAWWGIYGKDSWQANPWVWVVEFKRVEGVQP